ncbi:MAG TPA: hypothetical protein VM597_27890 [Gemmataceae bacterium]|jgi:hypothetical protein|nr:hypothetical protein [Gemmataceae bacterium]
MAGEDWPTFAPAVVRLLGEEDDPALWSAVVDAVYPDARALCQVVAGRWEVSTQLGRCSHWLRPHQTRWPADGGFAWPTGYDGPRQSREGLPEFDWSCEWHWRSDGQGWELADAAPGSKRLVFRVAVPARSGRHRQAAVHTVWRPGAAFGFDADVVQFYGFRQHGSGWTCTAYRASPWRAERLYEVAPDEGTA